MTTRRARSKETCLVIGGTGRCGAPLVESLLEKGYRVRVMTRDPHQHRATRLASRGAELVKGNLLDRTSLSSAFAGIARACLITTPAYGYAAEMEGAFRFLKEAEAARPDIVVFQSVLYAETTILHCWTKGQIEEALKSTSLPHTVLRPAIFFRALNSLLESTGKLVAVPIRTDIQVPWIGTDDVGRSLAEVMDQISGNGEIYDLAHTAQMSLKEAQEIIRLERGVAPCLKFAPVALEEEVRTQLEPDRADEFRSKYPDSSSDYFAPINQVSVTCDLFEFSRKYPVTLTDPRDFLKARCAWQRAVIDMLGDSRGSQEF